VREVELKLISELMKNSRRSDRELAKAIGASQPTVSRLIKKFEEEGYVQEYTMIPNFRKLGYEILALSFVKFSRMYSPEEVQTTKKAASRLFNEGPSEIFMIERGKGIGCQGVFISFHRNYSAYVEFEEWIRKTISSDISDIQTFLVNLNDHVRYRPMSFFTIAKHVLTCNDEQEKVRKRRTTT
jgi:DNA-binding Lrp family transcriptional regulator